MAWVNPRYRELTGREPPSAAIPTTDDRVAPEDRGVRLATLDRSGREGPETELRVSLSEYQSHKFLSLRVWIKNAQTGHFYPDPKRGISVRLREAEAVADAIREGLRLADDQGEAAPSKGGGPARRELPGQRRLPEVAAGGERFTEF